MNRSVVIFAVVVVVAVAVWVMSRGAGEVVAPTPDMDGGATMMPAPTPTASQQSDVVKYTASGFSPSTIIVKKGQTVTWVNESSSGMWTASAVHPTHKVYPGTDISMCETQTSDSMFDACMPVSSGQSWSFKFDVAGTWKYHNHVHSAHTGTVVVE